MKKEITPITNITKNPPQITHKQATILKTKAEHPDLTVREIAAVSKCDHALVVRTLKRYGIKQVNVDQFKRCRADIYAGLQEKVLSSITEDDIKRTSMAARVLSAMQLNTNERLERGMSTNNTSIQVGMNSTLQASLDALVKRCPDAVEASECADVAHVETDVP